MMLFPIILASCLALGSATDTQKSLFSKVISLNDKVFTDNIAFKSPAKSLLACAKQCSKRTFCTAFTFDQNTCRGHDVLMKQNAASTPAPRAKSYSRKRSGVLSTVCSGGTTGVERLTDASLGLDLDVYCEDGWMVFQRRQDGSVDFYRNWQNYTAGFGDVQGEFWLGLEPLHLITLRASYELRVDMASGNGITAFASYSDFYIGSAANNYTLHFDSFLNGTTGDSLKQVRDLPFSTLDADNDESVKVNCAVNRHGAWWYKACSRTNLNGNYHGQNESTTVHWSSFADRTPLKSCQMKIRLTA